MMARLPGILPSRESLTSDDWYTPSYIIDGIGLTYDLDPCAPVGGVSWIPAEHHYSIEDDGLLQPWFGRVWLNPPYSKPWPWLARLREHGNGIALVPADTATRGFQKSAPHADGICFLSGRVTFVHPDNDNVTSARFPSVLLAYGAENASALAGSGLGWNVSGRLCPQVNE